jgi:hypothetical protein
MHNVQNHSVLDGILLTCGKNLHDRIISLSGEVCAHKTSLMPPFVIEVAVPSQESEQSCICVRGIDFSSFFDFAIELW